MSFNAAAMPYGTRRRKKNIKKTIISLKYNN